MSQHLASLEHQNTSLLAEAQFLYDSPSYNLQMDQETAIILAQKNPRKAA